MTDNEFKMKVTEDIATIKSDIKHLKGSIPCEKIKSVDSKIKLNRSLIYILLTSYIGMITYFIQK